MKGLAESLWDRARLTLSTARFVLDKDPFTAASRAYYAAFYAISALFALENRAFRKHTAVRAALHRDLIRAGRLPPEIGHAYDYLMDARDDADYGEVSIVSREEARLAIEKAAGILEAVRKACPQLPDA
jgi:uncharacterized protein (UPF0332 family)